MNYCHFVRGVKKSPGEFPGDVRRYGDLVYRLPESEDVGELYGVLWYHLPSQLLRGVEGGGAEILVVLGAEEGGEVVEGGVSVGVCVRAASEVDGQAGVREGWETLWEAGDGVSLHYAVFIYVHEDEIPHILQDAVEVVDAAGELTVEGRGGSLYETVETGAEKGSDRSREHEVDVIQKTE